MVEILSAAPGLAGAGAGGLLLLLVMYLVKANRDDRAQNREIVSALREDHRKEADALTAKIDRLEKRVTELQRLVDDQRTLRWAAEERAARAEAQLAAHHQLTGATDDPASTRLPPPRPVGGMAPGTDPTTRGGDPGGGPTEWW